MESNRLAELRLASSKRVTRMWEISKHSEGLSAHSAELRMASADLITYAKELMKADRQLQIDLQP